MQQRSVNSALRQVAVVVLSYIDSATKKECILRVSNLVEIAARQHDAKRFERTPP
jgi:hypothetical protein